MKNSLRLAINSFVKAMEAAIEMRVLRIVLSLISALCAITAFLLGYSVGHALINGHPIMEASFVGICFITMIIGATVALIVWPWKKGII